MTEVSANPAPSLPVEETTAVPAATADDTTVPKEQENGVVAENGDAPAVNGATNGSAKTKKVKAEPEPPKDPQQDPIGWLKQQSKSAVHLANHQIVSWIQSHTEEDVTKHEAVGKNGRVTRNEFLAFLQDGTKLSSLANKLSPGSVETVHEGEEAAKTENQVSMVEAFLNFAKEKAGIAEDQLFSVADLREKGKAGYDAVFNTLFQIALKSQEQFNQASFNVDNFLQEVNSAVPSTIFTQLLTYFTQLKNNIFNKSRASRSDKQAAAENQAATATENGTTENGTAQNGVEANGTTTAVPVEENAQTTATN